MAKYVGTKVLDGHVVSFDMAEPRKRYVDGSGTKEKGLRLILVDGVARGYLVLPHGFKTCPELHNLKNGVGRENESHVTRAYVYKYSNDPLDSISKLFMQDFKAGKYPTQEELDKKKADDKAALEEADRLRKDSREGRIKEGMRLINRVRELAERLENHISDEDKQFFKKLEENLYNGFPYEVRERMKDD